MTSNLLTRLWSIDKGNITQLAFINKSNTIERTSTDKSITIKKVGDSDSKVYEVNIIDTINSRFIKIHF